jgi:hypothetical protein
MVRPGTLGLILVVQVLVSGSPTVVIVVVRTVVSSRSETAALAQLPRRARMPAGAVSAVRPASHRDDCRRE